MEIIIAILALVGGFVIGWRAKPKPDISVLKEDVVRTRAENAELLTEVGALRALNSELPRQIGILGGRALAENQATQQAHLSEFLQPFKEQMAKIERAAVENKATLEAQVKNLMATSGALSKEAADLSRALRGDKKLLGNFGELQLKRILEMTGLCEGRDYTCQEYFNDDGARFFTDFVILLPDDRRIVVDSKFTLGSYTDYVASGDAVYLRAFADATKKHIDILSSKDYQSKIQAGAGKLDFSVMFMPIEQAYMDLLSHDPKIYDYAFARRVMIATPSLLLPLVRTVENLWRIEKQNKNVEKVVASLQGLYDKYAGFTANFADVKSKLDGAIRSYDAAEVQLSGRGGLSSRFSNLAELGGIKTGRAMAITEEV